MTNSLEALIARTKNDSINGEYDGQPDVCNLITALEREVSMREQNLSIKLHMSERIAELEAAAVKPVKLPEAYGYLRENNGQIQISIGAVRPNDRSGGYATPWFAIYTAAGIQVEGSD